MGKTLISTLHFYNNFGSVLQAYALKHTLEKLGEQADVLPYRPNLPEWRYFQSEQLQREYEVKCEKFADFRAKYLGVKEITDSITPQWRAYDSYIVGSDIVWGKEFSDLDAAYFVQFAPENARKIAYAASVILSPDGHTENDALFEKWMPTFDAVAVRETSAVERIQPFTSRKVTAVLDPSLLLTKEEYEPLVIENEEMKKEPYLLSYFLTHDPAVVDYTNMLAKKLGLRVIHYFADYPDRIFAKDAGCFAFAGPGEFLGYVKNASCVFTNSFHGTCFAMIYRKPFYTYMAKRAMLSRVRDTVGRLGMEERFFYDFRDLERVPAGMAECATMDYTAMEQKLEVEKAKSLDFLSRALKGEAYV